ncbi:PREDICTED: uncharacterized protein LOC103330486 [Prunus mume]|uniref:Uncharacterized protein LOC103330486 n=1 Tax=Prunus mume TaxID=102107 RepID=A0ABM0NXK4_PRUMU|nr:PREDICTED: uncharacterized protein LOC103330486 [Prunus mume]
MGFRNWKKKERIRNHIGGVGSVHNQSRQYCIDLMHQKPHIQTVLGKQSDQAHIDYSICLTASLACLRFLLKQGLPFRGHDESDTSNNRGNYLELLQFLADHDEKVKAVVLENAPGNLKLIAPTIQKDLMVMGFRYVDKSGDVIERFVGIQHVSDTTSNSLKEAIDTLFSIEELSISMLRGRGYDGASNMKALVVVTKGNVDIATFFTSCNSLVNIVGASLLKLIIEDGSTDNIGEANKSLRDIQSFEFVFCLFFMRSILGVTNDLSQALQRKDQDIGNAMTLVKDCKDQLQHMRENAFEALLDQVSFFCGKHDIEVPNMDDAYVAQWRSHWRAPRITHLHHYHVDIFIQIIEWQLAELNLRFSEPTLPVATASVERSFFAMNIVKGPLRNRMGDQWLSDSLLVYIEKDVFICIDNDSIMQRFQSMKTRREKL